MLALAVTLSAAPKLHAQQRGPVEIPRKECEPSIHEGFSGRQSAGYKQVNPVVGLLPASYEWLGGVVRALGSLVQPFAADPTYLGFKSGQQPFFFSRKGGVSRFYRSFKVGGGERLTERPVPDSGVPGRRCPGDPYWVGFPRPGNTEFPPPFQLLHDTWDCFCRYDEEVACPTGSPPPKGVHVILNGPNLHERYGGSADFISCVRCFGIDNITKHDYLVGTRKGKHIGYPSMASDPGYQECLRQSVTSGSLSEPFPPPIGEDIYGL